MHNLVSLLSSVYYLPQRVVYSARKVTAFFWNMQIYLYFCQNNPQTNPFLMQEKRQPLPSLFCMPSFAQRAYPFIPAA